MSEPAGEYEIAPVERITEVDRMMIVRMEARIAALQAEANGLQAFVTAHLAAVYKLQPGDQVEDDGTLKRVQTPTEEPT